MALKFSGKLNCADTDDFLDEIKDLAVAAGWTLHDDQSAASPRAYILKSTGENDDQMPVYMRFYQGTNMVLMQMFGYWDSTTHAGTYYAASLTYSRVMTDDDASFDAYIVASKDSIVAAAFISTKWNAIVVGRIDPFTDDADGTLQNAESAGSNVVVELGTGEAAGFWPGRQYQIIGQTYRQWVTVNAINTTTDTVTITTLSYAMEAGAHIGNCPHRWFHFGSEYQYSFRFRYDTNGGGNETSQVTSSDYGMINSNYTDPNPRGGGDDVYTLWPYNISDNNCLAGIMDQSCLYLRADVNSSSSEHILSVNEWADGTSSGTNSTTTLNDTGESWTVNQWAGKAVAIIAGTGAGQVRTIASNTATGLTVSEAWTVTPDATSEYAISDEFWLYLYVNNNVSYSGAMRMI